MKSDSEMTMEILRLSDITKEYEDKFLTSPEEVVNLLKNKHHYLLK